MYIERLIIRGYKHTDKNLYLNSSSMLLKDFASELANLLIQESDNKVIHRLEDIYEDIYFDEAQDLAGYDIEIVKSLFLSNLNITLVGDPLQATFATNNNNQKTRITVEQISKNLPAYVRYLLYITLFHEDAMRQYANSQ